MELLLEKLGINWQLLLAQIVNFGILVGVLTALVYRPLFNVIDARAERIRKAIEQAERSEQEARELAKIRVDRLKQIDAEAGVLLEAAKKKADQLQHEVLAHAKEEADRILERGRSTLEQERRHVQVELQDTIAHAVVRLTETLLRREFSDEDQKAMLKELSEKIPAMMS